MYIDQSMRFFCPKQQCLGPAAYLRIHAATKTVLFVPYSQVLLRTTSQYE